MKEFLKITPENHEKVIRQVQGKLYVVYFSSDCYYCRQAIRDLIRMPENRFFTFGVCQVDGEQEFRLKERILSLPTMRIYENGRLLSATNGYNRPLDADPLMRESMERVKDHHEVYADNAATTRMSRKALQAYNDCARNVYGNASTGYGPGHVARERLTRARGMILTSLGAMDGRLVFTSGGSEADNLALHSAFREGLRQNRKHIITSAVEHHAVLHTLEQYRKEGFEITVLPVDPRGRVDPAELEAAIRPDTILVSIMFANNETGTIQPVGEIGGICQRHGVLFHCDAVQAAGHVDINVTGLHIDYLSVSAHKFRGPKGMGALIVSKAAPVYPLILGGGQEGGLRAGTEDVPGAWAMAAALEQSVRHMKAEAGKLRSMTGHILSVLQEVPGVHVNGDPDNRLPGTVNLSFEGIGGRELLFLLEARYGICVSGGSACNTSSGKPSHVLLALGLSEELADSAIRISLGHDNAPEDADYIACAIKESVEMLRIPG